MSIDPQMLASVQSHMRIRQNLAQQFGDAVSLDAGCQILLFLFSRQLERSSVSFQKLREITDVPETTCARLLSYFEQGELVVLSAPATDSGAETEVQLSGKARALMERSFSQV